MLRATVYSVDKKTFKKLKKAFPKAYDGVRVEFPATRWNVAEAPIRRRLLFVKIED